ncbi:mechanosensitive ion channel [Lachnospiraceae bacterium ZAX-1]
MILSELDIESLDELENLKPNIIKEYLEELAPNIVPGILNFLLYKVLVVLLLYVIGTKLIHFVLRAFERFLERANVQEGAKQFFASFAKAVLYFLLFVMIASVFGVTTSSIITLLGSAGLAVGLALQGSLSNFAGGVLILLIKPFKIGDYIVDSSKNEGTVTEIQLFYTKLTTADNKIVIIPNGILSNSSITNVTGDGKRRVDISMRISYRADLKKVKKILTCILEQEDRRIKEEEVSVFIESMEESSIKITCRLWVPAEDFWAVKCEITEIIKYKFDENEIGPPYSQLEVSIKKSEI